MPAEAAHSAAASAEELRRLRRLISNRESARRCRLRKQRRLEELMERVTRLRADNADLGDQLRCLAHHCLLLRLDNDDLRCEASALDRRLHDLHRALALRQLQLQHRSAAPPLAACAYEEACAPSVA